MTVYINKKGYKRASSKKIHLICARSHFVEATIFFRVPSYVSTNFG